MLTGSSGKSPKESAVESTTDAIFGRNPGEMNTAEVAPDTLGFNRDSISAKSMADAWTQEITGKSKELVNRQRRICQLTNSQVL